MVRNFKVKIIFEFSQAALGVISSFSDTLLTRYKHRAEHFDISNHCLLLNGLEVAFSLEVGGVILARHF